MKFAERPDMDSGKSSCYCCTSKPSTANCTGMEIDAALNELGMLSSVTEGRKQYLAERRGGMTVDHTLPRGSYCYGPPDTRSSRYTVSTGGRRNRNLSESGLDPAQTTSPTPSNSPSKGFYQVMTLNPEYVVSVCTAANPQRNSSPTECSSAPLLEFGDKYTQDKLESEARYRRSTRACVKFNSRMKRFRKPYDVPWRQESWRSQLQCLRSDPLHDANMSPLNLTAAFGTPERTSRAADKLCYSSNTSTPEKPPDLLSLTGSNNEGTKFPRSKSLDELDFAKLQLAEAENHNIIVQRKEIDRMSQHLQNLQVNE